MRVRRPVAVTVALVGLSLVLAACGSDDPSADDPSTSVTAANEPYPPNDTAALRAEFDPMVEPLGLRFTRGALIDRREGGYEISDTGNHLALYVEPIDDDSYPPERYVRGLYETAALVSPHVFDSWSALDSYDICQEPHQASDDGPEPFPATQVELTRAANDDYDWDNGSLATLIPFLEETEGARLLVSQSLIQHPDYQAALAEAGLAGS